MTSGLRRAVSRVPGLAIKILDGPTGYNETGFARKPPLNGQSMLSVPVANGTTFCGLNVSTARVLYLDGENPLVVVREHLQSLGISKTENLIIWGGWNDAPPSPPQSPIILNFASQENVLIIYNPAVAFNPGDENSSNETRKFMDHLRRLAHQGASITLLHHTGKSRTSQDYRGSSDYKGSVDMACSLRKLSEKEGGIDRLALESFKSRIAPGKNLGLQFREGAGLTAFDAPVMQSVSQR